MPHFNQEMISVLKTLIDTCNDGENGYQTAAHCARDSELKALLGGYGQQRAGYAGELKREVERLGGHSDKTGTMAGALQHGWTRIKSAVTGGSDQALIDGCGQGEDAALQDYEEALKQNLSGEVRALVERQRAGVQDTRDRIRGLQQTANPLPGPGPG